MKFSAKFAVVIVIVVAAALLYYVLNTGLSIFAEAPLMAIPIFVVFLVIVYALLRGIYHAIRR